MNLGRAIRRVLDAHPEKRILTILDSAAAVRAVFSAGEIAALADQWTARFRSAGVVPGSVVALSPPRDETLLAVHLGAMACGAVLVPLNPALAPSELSALLLECEPSVIATSAALAHANKKTAAALGAPWWIIDGEAGHVGAPFGEPPRADAAAAPTTDTTAAASVDPDGAERSGDDTLLVLYTSGTTGRPKSVALSHANLLANLDALAKRWQHSDTDRLLHMLPAHHFHGLVLALYGSLVCGNEIVLMPAFDARATLDAIAAHAITVVMAVPTIYNRMLSAASGQEDLSSLRLAISGSAPLGQSLWQRFKDRFAIEVVERYGLTETGIVAANAPGTPRAGSVGTALPDTTITLLCESGYIGAAPGTTSEQGEICVSGPSVMTAYGNDTQASLQTLHHDRFHTGDLGHFDEHGYLWIDGRLKDLIIVGGTNVVPAEVERVLQRVDGVAEIVAVGQADDDLGEIVVAYVVADSGDDDQEALETRLRDAARSALARYKQPRHYFFISELPRNLMGKIDRGRLSHTG